MRPVYAITVGLLATIVALLFAASAAGLIDDDAYIFLRYAEHLAAGHGLSFNIGEPSAGITSPLWVALLAFVRWLTGADPVTVAQVAGALCFGGAVALITWSLQRDGERPAIACTSGVLIALSPVFVCQAISGMEVALNMLLVSVAVAWLGRSAATSAAAAGLSFATRPDNLLLAPLVVALQERKPRAVVLVGCAILLFGLPWMIYCYATAGLLLPPTRTGKLLVFLPGWYGITAEQFVSLLPLDRLALAGRALGRVGLIFTEGQARGLLPWIALLPLGLRFASRRTLAPLLLFAVLALAYAVAFPLVKLRYFVHVLPWLIPVGVIAIARRLRPAGCTLALAVLLLLHGALCVRAYPRYRAWVECEGTKTIAGRWLAEHTAPDARLALEPIGAIGYHSNRYVIDLGGLIGTDVWPVIRNGPFFDPDELLAYLHRRGADYLVDAVDGPWAGRLLPERPDSLQLEASLPGAPGCGATGVYALRRSEVVRTRTTPASSPGTIPRCACWMWRACISGSEPRILIEALPKRIGGRDLPPPPEWRH